MTSIMVLTLEDIMGYAKECFAAARNSHGWDHTERVYRLCMHIGQVEGADLEVLAVAAYLHDVGRSYEDESKGAICHAAKQGASPRSVTRSWKDSSKGSRRNMKGRYNLASCAWVIP
jgi:HD superfamily phosphodiesterase